MDCRPLEEIAWAKRVTVVSDADIDTMLYEDTAAAASSLPARIASLRVTLQGCSLLPAAVARLQDLGSLSLMTSDMQIVDDDDDGGNRELAAAARDGTATAADSAAASSSQSRDEGATALALSVPPSRGLRQLPLHSLELVHVSSPPLSSAQLPSSLTMLTISNRDLCDRTFFGSQLAQLTQLRLTHIRSLRQLPESVGLLQSLEALTITQCPQLTALPRALMQLPSLATLNVSANNIVALPDCLDQLPALRSLNVQHNRLRVLPRVFEALRERGCTLIYDEQLMQQHQCNEDNDAFAPPPSSVTVEEIDEDEEAEGAAAAAAAPVANPSSSVTTPTAATAAKTKRKLPRSDEDPSDDEAHLHKHARSSTAHSSSLHAAAAAGTSAAAVAAAVEGEGEGEGIESADAVATAALATSRETSQRSRPAVGKRRLDDAAASDSSSAAALKKRKFDPAMLTSFKYWQRGELEYTDRIPTGFIDPGRHSRLFSGAESAAAISLESVFAQAPDYGAREVVLVDEQRDVRLRQIQRQARLTLKQQGQMPQQPSARSVDELQLQVKLLACLVSDSFGGRVVVYSPHQSALDHAGTDQDMIEAAAAAAGEGPQGSPAAAAAAAAGGAMAPRGGALPSPPPSFLSPLSSLSSLCHAECAWWKRQSHSNCVLLCSIQHGLCRHRSLLMKLLVDELFAPVDVQCKLVRGFREGGIGHAWNVIRIRGHSEFIVDCLDSPMLFRPLSALADPVLAYFPQFSESSSSAFSAPLVAQGDSAAAAAPSHTLASFKDLHLSTRGRLIGEGAYSQVFECHLPSSAGHSSTCALKVTQIGHLSAFHLSSLLKEIRLLPHLQHPNIVRFLAYLITNSELKLYLELIRGQNLDVVVKAVRAAGQRLAVEDIVVIALEAAKGLQYLHENATLHRDLKSAQILVGHPALHEGHAATAFAMPLPLPNGDQARRAGRAIFKAKRKGLADAETNAATASSSASSTLIGSGSAAGAGAASASLLPAPVGSDLSFFSSAHIALCDFNIAVPVVEPSGDADADGVAHSAPLLEYVGTLRWCAPEVFRASGPHAAPSAAAAAAAAAVPVAARPSGAAAAAAAVAPSVSAARPSSAAMRLHAGRMGDVWSYSMVLLELLSLKLPFEDVQTEEQLNQMLIRGERSTFQPWLDDQLWTDVAKEDPAVVEKKARAAWERVVATSASSSAAASAPASPIVAASASPSSLRRSAYEALVGLYLVGTSSVPEDRPSIQQIRAGLETLHQQLTIAKARSMQPLSLESASAAAPSASAAGINLPRQEGAPSPKLAAVSHKHAAPASNSPPLRSTRARLNAAADKLPPPPQQPISPSLAL